MSEKDLNGHQIDLSLNADSLRELAQVVCAIEVTDDTISPEDDSFTPYESSVQEFIGAWKEVLEGCKKESLGLVVTVSG